MTVHAPAAPTRSATTHPIPIGAQSNDHTARLAGIPTRRFFTDAAAFVGAQLLVTDYYRFDTSRAEREFGFTATVPFGDGLARTVRWYEQHRTRIA